MPLTLLAILASNGALDARAHRPPRFSRRPGHLVFILPLASAHGRHRPLLLLPRQKASARDELFLDDIVSRHDVSPPIVVSHTVRGGLFARPLYTTKTRGRKSRRY